MDSLSFDIIVCDYKTHRYRENDYNAKDALPTVVYP